MHLPSIISTVLLTAASFARVHNGDDEEPSTIANSAFLACATKEARDGYGTCSSSISAQIKLCGERDIGCACSLAIEGFKCLTSTFPSKTMDLCAASVVLKGLCALGNVPGPSLPSTVTCPSESEIGTFVASRMPSDMASFILTGVIPLGVNKFMPSSINNIVPSSVSFWKLPAVVDSQGSAVVTGTKRQLGSAVERVVDSMSAPSATGAANGAFAGLKRRRGEWEGKRIFPVFGICVTLGVVLLAAFL